jgi:hypothetical protein
VHLLAVEIGPLRSIEREPIMRRFWGQNVRGILANESGLLWDLLTIAVEMQLVAHEARKLSSVRFGCRCQVRLRVERVALTTACAQGKVPVVQLVILPGLRPAGR